MSDDEGGRAILAKKIEAYLELRKTFAVGFVRFVLERGLETKAPPIQGRREETWRQTGQRLYGLELFEATLAAEVDTRRKARAERAVPTVRSDQGKDGRQGRAARGRQDQRGEDYELPGRGGTAEPS